MVSKTYRQKILTWLL